jgi:hypothetical protein
MNDNINPGEWCIAGRDIIVDDKVAFVSGERLIVERVEPNPERPEYKYVVFSSRLQKRFQLSSNEISPIGRQAGAPVSPHLAEVSPEVQKLMAPGLVPVAHPRSQTRRGGGRAPGSLKWILIGVSACLVIGAIVVVIMVIGRGKSSPGAAFEAFSNAALAKEFDQAYGMLTSDSREMISKNEFKEMFEDYPGAQVASSGFDGDTGWVTLAGTNGESAKIDMKKEGGSWKINIVSDLEAAWRRTCQANQRTVDGAIQSYEAIWDSNPMYPSSLEDMTQPGTRTLKEIPTCPAGDKPYIWVDDTPPYISCPNCPDHEL